MRFNYQQRVGRAGRRGAGLSLALTLCRGRSHDDYYFDNPDLITSAPVPSPTVDMRRKEIAYRVAAKEVLYRALRGEPELEEYAQDNVHGEFGAVVDWAVRWRSRVERWIVENQVPIQDLCDALSRRSGVGSSVLVDYVTTALLGRIDDALLDRNLQEDALGKQLAYRGVLPMFGFPTRVRSLYTQWRQDRTNGGTIDREIETAIGQFAPGAQTVKDDNLYTAVGLVKWVRDGRSWDVHPDPFGQEIRLGLCRRCQDLNPHVTPDTVLCRRCGAGEPEGFRTTVMVQPPDFATNFRRHASYDGNFEFSPRTLGSRLAVDRDLERGLEQFLVESITGDIYRLNDNGGRDFDFQRELNGRRWLTAEADAISLDAFRRDRGANEGAVVDLDESTTMRRSLGVRMSTDVVVAGLAHDAWPQLDLSPARAEGRSAWYSLAFLLRRAAAYRLDIGPSELTAGIQPYVGRDGRGRLSARIFLADVLENGAGYALEIGNPVLFRSLLRGLLNQTDPDDHGRPYGSGLVSDRHVSECATSCYHCLREYQNMPLHPLLDWRLALDIAELMLDANPSIGLEAPRWRALTSDERMVDYFEGLYMQYQPGQGLPLGLRDSADGSDPLCLVLTHPLWCLDRDQYAGILGDVVSTYEGQGYRVEVRSLFQALRTPWEAVC